MVPNTCRIIIFFLISLLFAFITVGCSRSVSKEKVSIGENVIALVNGESISLDWFKRELNQMKKKYRLESDKKFSSEELFLLKTKTLNELVRTVLFLQQAKNNQIQVSEDEFEQALQEMRIDYQEDSFNQVFEMEDIDRKDWEQKLKNGILVKKLIKKVVNSKVTVDETSLKDYFDAHPEEFQKLDKVKALHIMVDTEEEARKMLKKLKPKAENFSELAVKYSLGPEGIQGGDLGYFEAGQMPVEFDSVFKLELNKVSDVIRTPYGYHLFKVVDKIPARNMSFEESKKKIHAKILKQKQEIAFQKWIQEIHEQAEVTLNEESFVQVS